MCKVATLPPPCTRVDTHLHTQSHCHTHSKQLKQARQVRASYPARLEGVCGATQFPGMVAIVLLL